MKKIIINISAILLFAVVGCQEEGTTVFFDGSGDAPAQIEDVEITPTAGGATVKYAIPDDDNFEYVKAVYEAPAGVPREAKSSRYGNTLVLEGFGDTDIHEVSFYSVGKNRKESEPIVESFNPLTPPVFDVYESLKVNAIFGGVEVLYENGNEANIIIELYYDKEKDGEFVLLDRQYTNSLSGRFVVRNMDAEDTDFEVLVKDPFGNNTDFFARTLTPLLETAIPKDRMADLKLPNDVAWLRTSNPIQQLWDDSGNNKNNFFATDQGVDPFPKWISLDFGYKCILSRMKMWKRYGYDEGRIPDKWELYGSNSPNPDGSWDSWTLIEQFNEGPYKPSGLPLGQSTAEDEEVAQAGYDYEFTNVANAYRFYRFKWLNTPNGERFVIIAEMSFWGQIVEE